MIVLTFHPMHLRTCIKLGARDAEENMEVDHVCFTIRGTKIEAIQQNLKGYGENGGPLVFKPFGKLAIEDVEALRYRAEDVSRTVGRASVRDARVREIRTELLNSDRLAAHFDDNPDELILLKHDFRLAKQRALPHLNHLPNYLRGGKPVKRF